MNGYSSGYMEKADLFSKSALIAKLLLLFQFMEYLIFTADPSNLARTLSTPDRLRFFILTAFPAFASLRCLFHRCICYILVLSHQIPLNLEFMMRSFYKNTAIWAGSDIMIFRKWNLWCLSKNMQHFYTDFLQHNPGNSGNPMLFMESSKSDAHRNLPCDK